MSLRDVRRSFQSNEGRLGKGFLPFQLVPLAPSLYNMKLHLIPAISQLVNRLLRQDVNPQAGERLAPERIAVPLKLLFPESLN